MWQSDTEFVAWLDQEKLGTNEAPLDDDTLYLMYQAWVAAKQIVHPDQWPRTNLREALGFQKVGKAIADSIKDRLDKPGLTGIKESDHGK